MTDQPQQHGGVESPVLDAFRRRFVRNPKVSELTPFGFFEAGWSERGQEIERLRARCASIEALEEAARSVPKGVLRKYQRDMPRYLHLAPDAPIMRWLGAILDALDQHATTTPKIACNCGQEGTPDEIADHVERMRKLPHNASSDYHATTTQGDSH